MASVKRYKISKDQLERVVESFVMESANIESKKAPVKNHIPSQSADAKKHIKNKMTGKMVEKGEGVPAPAAPKKKLSQAHDAKKHISKAKATHSTKAKVVKEGEGDGNVLDGNEVWNMIKGDIPKLQQKTQAAKAGNSDFMAEPLTEEEQGMSNMAPKEIYNKLYPRLKDAVNKLGAVREDGSVDMELLKNEAKRKSFMGKLLMNLGIGTSIAGITTTAVTWLLKNEIYKSMDSGLATCLTMGGLGVLIVGGIIAAIGQPKGEAGEQGTKAHQQMSKKMGQ